MKTLKNISVVLMTMFLTGVFVLTVAHPGYSIPVYYTDFASFDTVTTTTIVEDFETVSPKDTPLSSFVSNGNTYTAIASTPAAPNVWVSSPGYTNYGVPITTSSILTATGDEDFTVDFGNPTSVLGFDTYLNSFGPVTLQLFGLNGLLDTRILDHDPTQVGFLGIIASESIYSMRWTSINGRVTNTGIDNIRQGTVQQPVVPEPSTLTFLGIGLIAISLSKFWRRYS